MGKMLRCDCDAWPTTGSGLGRVKTLGREEQVEHRSTQASCPRKLWQARSETGAPEEHDPPPWTLFRSFYTDRVINRHAGGMEHTRICNCRILPFAPY